MPPIPSFEMLIRRMEQEAKASGNETERLYSGLKITEPTGDVMEIQGFGGMSAAWNGESEE